MEESLDRLLIVEDDPGFRRVLSQAMGRRGFAVTQADSVHDALLAARQKPPRYALLDVKLQGDCGLDLIRPLLELAPDCRIVVLTGYACIPTAVQAVKMGAYDYLAKPENASVIERVLRGEARIATEKNTDDLMTVQSLEWEYLQRMLDMHGGNITATAEALKMHRRSLQRKLARRRPSDDASAWPR